MAVEGFIGRPGAGKTYELTRRALLEADRDRLVFTNYPIVHPNIFLFEPDQLLDLPPGLVLIDEAHLWFPARGSLQLPMSWLAGMSQTRKAGWDMYWSAQHENRVDAVVKNITNWMWLSGAWGNSNGHPRLFTRTSWEPEKFRKVKKHASRSWSLYSERVASSYNTHARVEQAAHTVKKDDPYAKSKRNTSVLAGVV